jgi:hypothetical protein
MKIGNYGVPSNPFRLPKLVEDVKRIYDTYKADVIKNPNKNDALAQLLEYKSSRNGQYWNKVAAMRAFGLLEGRGDVRVSELAKHLTYGTESQKKDAAQKVFFNIPLWKELYNRYRLQLPKQDFWAKLQNITGCEAPEARSNEQFVYEAFSEDAKVLETVNIQGSASDEFMQTDEQPLGTPQFIEIKAGPYFHRLPLTAQGKKVAIETIQMLDVPEPKPGRPEKGEK